MHELAITRGIVDACSEQAEGKRVLRVTLEIGTLSCVMPDALRFCYDVAAADTPLEGSTLDIIRIKALTRCLDCGRDVAMDDVLSLCPCGSENLAPPIGGDELRIKSMEIEDPALETT